jgi:thioredoxin-disulfide reductase
MKKEKIDEKEKTYDFVIIGAGVTGMAAAMYAARLGLRTLCLGKSSSGEMPIGGIITTTDSIENYPGFVHLTGEELANKIRDHTLSYPLAEIKNEGVESVKKQKNLFLIKTSEHEYKGITILFATGARWKGLECKGSKEFENKGIAYCALCDAPLYRNKVVGLIGGSDGAAKDALVLSKYAKKVYIIYRREQIRPEPVNMKKIEEAKNIEIINKANVIEVKGDKRVKGVVLDRKYNGSNELALDGVFVAIGHTAISELAKELGVRLNEKEEIIIDHKTSETNIEGIYAAGDVVDKPFKQAITGVAEGCTAAYSAFEYLKKSKRN